MTVNIERKGLFIFTDQNESKNLSFFEREATKILLKVEHSVKIYFSAIVYSTKCKSKKN